MILNKCCMLFDLRMGVRYSALLLVALCTVGIVTGVIQMNQVLILTSIALLLLNSLLLRQQSSVSRLTWLVMTPPIIVLALVAGVLINFHKRFLRTIEFPFTVVLSVGAFAFAVIYIYIWIVVFSLHRYSIAHPEADLENIESQFEDSNEKCSPPEYTDIVLEPPPPDYSTILFDRKLSPDK